MGPCSTSTHLVQGELDGDALELSPLDAHADPVAGGPAEAQPGRELGKVGQHLLVQLQVLQLALALQRRHVDLVVRQIFGEPVGDWNRRA